MMMKSITFFFGFVLFFFVNSVFSQCDPDFDFGGIEWGVSPDASSGEQFETAYLNVPYSDVFHIVVPSDASAIDPMFQLPLDSVLLSEIILTETLTLEQYSLGELGLEMVCNNLGASPTPCSWIAGQQYCAALEGTPTVPGVYHMSIATEAWVTVFGVGVAQPYSFGGYIFEVIGESTGCMDELACNFNPGATIPDPEACTYPEPNQDCGGYCIDPAACNYVEDPESVSGVSIYSQSFEGFAPGDYISDDPNWITWSGQEGTDGDAQISDEQAHTGENSLHIYANSAAGGPLDVVMLVGLDEGVYTASWMMYVTDGNSAYYNIQEDVSPGVGWAFEVTFAFTGDLQVVMDGATVGSGVFPIEEWFEVRHDLDLDNDMITLTIAGNVVGSFTFDSPFGGVNFFGYGDGTTVGNWFVDDMEIHDGTEGEDPAPCTYPGCQDPLASNYDATAGCAGECVYLAYDCSSVGDDAWSNEAMGLFPDWQEAMHGVPWEGEWVFNVPATMIEPGSGVSYGVHHVDWLGMEGMPDWATATSFDAGEAMGASTQHCIAAFGTPTLPGMHAITATGEVFISIFGQPFSIGEQSFSATLEVMANPNPIPGCTYPLASNYLSYATLDDGGCEYWGCTDIDAADFNPFANIDDGSCGDGCDPLTGSNCASDSNGDGQVNVTDLLILLGEFGGICE